MRRRHFCLAGAASMALAACAFRPDHPVDQIRDTSSGLSLSPAELAARIGASDICLMGELHDNPHHHSRRAGLLSSLSSGTPVVVEYLPQDARPVLPLTSDRADLLGSLSAQGFDARAWQWPLHAPLFSAMVDRGHIVVGGNLAQQTARDVARNGASALPPELRMVLDAAPLDAAAAGSLDDSLIQGHCGHLTAARLPAMGWAQRGRDAAMYATIVEQMRKRPAQPATVVLLAGNGHVRRDYGVAQLLRMLQPQWRVLLIGFAELGETLQETDDRSYDIVWRTPAADREDPCLAFRSMPRPTR